MRRILRTTAISSVVLLVGAIGAAPAGAWDVIDDRGNTTSYEIIDDQDMRGANCIYEKGSKDLDRISIRGPKYVHGAHPYLQWISYRYFIQRNPEPTGDGIFTTIHKSPKLYAKADENENPKSWPRRTWTAPEVTSGQYRVRVVLSWYTKTSKAKKDQTGVVIIQYEYYKQAWNGTFDVDTGYCDAEYS